MKDSHTIKVKDNAAARTSRQYDENCSVENTRDEQLTRYEQVTP